MHFLKLSQAALLGSTLMLLSACSSGDAQAEQTEAPSHAQNEVQNMEPLGVSSGNYTMDKTHGYVTFSYLHKGLSNPQLRFNNVDAKLVLDAEHPEKSQVMVTIKAANIDSGVPKFDTHLNSADFFNTAESPLITFTSTELTRSSAKEGKMTGMLTMMGVSKPIEFDVTLIGTSEDAVGVEARGSLLRSDFGLGKYVPYVGDEVSIVVSAEFHKDK